VNIYHKVVAEYLVAILKCIGLTCNSKIKANASKIDIERGSITDSSLPSPPNPLKEKEQIDERRKQQEKE
jgi:hypothetical protein